MIPCFGGSTNPNEVRPAEMTEKPKRAVSPLAEVEMETVEEGREWTRKRLEKKLQRLAESQGATSPPQRSEVEEGLRTGDHDHNDGG